MPHCKKRCPSSSSSSSSVCSSSSSSSSCISSKKIKKICKCYAKKYCCKDSSLNPFGYFYCTQSQNITTSSNVIFQYVGPSTTKDIVWNSSDTVAIMKSGTYKITFMVAVQPTELGQFTLFLNTTAALSGTFGSGVTGAPVSGSLIVDVQAPMNITVKNYTSTSGTITTPASMGGTTVNSVNAYLMIETMSLHRC